MEGFEYAITEYGDDIKDPEYQRLRKEYFDASKALAKYLNID